jgi:glycerol-3-phosphate dehydrogenase
VVWNYSGVRPLVNEGDIPAHAVTRDYVLELNGLAGEPVLLNIFGGKITTYRRLAEDALAKLAPWLEGKRTPWTHDTSLPGGDLPVDGADALAPELEGMCPGLGAATASRLARAYGTMAKQIFANVRSAADLGRDFGAGLYEREVCHLVANEWAVTAEDVVWRRSKLGLRMTDHEIQVLEEWLATKHRLPQTDRSSGLARGNISSETALRDSRAIRG